MSYLYYDYYLLPVDNQTFSAMRKLFASVIYICCTLFSPAFSQISVNTNGSPADSSAILDISSSNKGVLFPRLSSPQILAIHLPAAGLFVYNTTLNIPLYFDGKDWRKMDGSIPVTKGMVYGGGIVFYVDETGEHGLISAIEDQSTSAPWGCFGTTIPDAFGTIVGTGITNTKKIAAGCSEDSIAAKICYELSLNGYDDWFLPSLDELSKLYEQREIVGGFGDTYWSSSQWDSQRSYVYSFAAGSRPLIYKYYTYPSVRCIRNTNQSPELPTDPSPTDNSADQFLGIISLSWTCSDPENDPITYDVYFGTVPTPVTLIASAITATSFLLTDTLESLTTYYWRVVAMDNHVNNITEGDTWQFTTGDWMCGDDLDYSEQLYSTVQVGNQCWMAENLNAGTQIDSLTGPSNNGIIEKYCYRDSTSNCEIYGGMYAWDEMMQYSTSAGAQGICPSGWHLPEYWEWDTLINYLGGNNVAGGAVKETGTTHWTSPNYGATNSSGFTALPGGYKSSSYSGRGTRAEFFTSSLGVNPGWAWTAVCTYSDDDLNLMWQLMNIGENVRCVKD